MSDWIPFNDGLPNVIVKELEIHYDGGTLVRLLSEEECGKAL